jgi:dynein heavy chain
MNSHLPAIEVLSNPGLRESHWEDIQSVMNIKFNFKEGTLRELLNKGVETYLFKIDEISENASKEFSLENALNKMEKEWDDLKVVVMNFKNRNVLIL